MPDQSADDFEAAVQSAAAKIAIAREEADDPSGHETRMMNRALRLVEMIQTIVALEISLEDIRSNPDSSSEKIMVAAREYRAQEAEMNKLLGELVQSEKKAQRSAQ